MGKNKSNLLFFAVEILSCATAYSSIEFPKKNSLFSWVSKKIVSNELENCTNQKQRLEVLKDGLDKGYLDLFRIHELYRECKINSFEISFLSQRELYNHSNIDQLTFAESLIDIFLNEENEEKANEENGLVDILSEQCGIEKMGYNYMKLFTYCLPIYRLKKIPLVVVEIPELTIVQLRSENDVNTHPDQDFSKAVMAANIEEMVEIYNTFFAEKIAYADNTEESHFGHTEKYYYRRQKEILCDGIFKYLARNPVYLQIGEKTVTITGNRGYILEGQNTVTSDGQHLLETFQSIINEIKNQSGLEDQDALHVMKQFLLGFRGQNEQKETLGLVQIPMLQASLDQIFVIFENESCMFFENIFGSWELQSKVDSSRIKGLERNSSFFTYKCRFKFDNDPEDEKIRTNLSIISTRIPSNDGTIQWSCEFRENPPTKIIFYGGCKKAKPLQSQ